MKYELIHRTTYVYEGTVTVSHHMARLAPRSLPNQRCPWHELAIFPTPVGRGVNADAFGNVTTYFELEGSHGELEVIARSLVEVFPTEHPKPASTPTWEAVKKACEDLHLTASSEAGAFRFSSPMVPVGKEFADYAKAVFPVGRPILEAVMALMSRIHREFKFDTVATDVATPV